MLFNFCYDCFVLVHFNFNNISPSMKQKHDSKLVKAIKDNVTQGCGCDWDIQLNRQGIKEAVAVVLLDDIIVNQGFME